MPITPITVIFLAADGQPIVEAKFTMLTAGEADASAGVEVAK